MIFWKRRKLHASKDQSKDSEKLIFEKGVFVTRNMIASLSVRSKKQEFEGKVWTVICIGYGLLFLSAYISGLAEKYGLLSVTSAKVLIWALLATLLILSTAAFLAILRPLLEVLWDGYTFQSDQIDLLATTEEALLKKIEKMNVPKKIPQQHADRIELTVKLWRERTAIYTVLTAIAAATQVLSTSTGINFFGLAGWGLIFGGGLGVLLLKIHAERFERLRYVLQRAAASQGTPANAHER